MLVNKGFYTQFQGVGAGWGVSQTTKQFSAPAGCQLNSDSIHPKVTSNHTG